MIEIALYHDPENIESIESVRVGFVQEMITKLRLKGRAKARQVNEEEQNVYFRLSALCMPAFF